MHAYVAGHAVAQAERLRMEAMDAERRRATNALICQLHETLTAAEQTLRARQGGSILDAGAAAAAAAEEEDQDQGQGRRSTGEASTAVSPLLEELESSRGHIAQTVKALRGALLNDIPAHVARSALLLSLAQR